MASGLKYFLSDKPKVPPFTPLDIGKEEGAAISEQRGLLPELSAFASEFNKQSADQMMASLERMLPGYGAMLNKGSEQIRSLLAGEVPADVASQLERKAAERGVSLGYGGSDFGENQFLRNFGLTSLQLVEEGLNRANQWMTSAAARTPVFNMASAFLPINQRIQLREQENMFKFQRDWLRNQIAAVPWGVKGWAINLADRIEGVGNSIVSSYAGGMTGGMGGMGGGGGGGGGGGTTWPSFGGGYRINPNPGSGGGYSGDFFTQGPQ